MINLLKKAGGERAIAFFTFFSILVSSEPVYSQVMTAADSAVRNASVFVNITRVKVPSRPFLFLNMEEIRAARKIAENEPWAAELKNDFIRKADEWVDRDYEFIRKIIPPAGSVYTYGLGLDLDPVQQKKMVWRGWKDPRHVMAADGCIYPDELHHDDGSGWTDPVTGSKYYFIALANGMTIKQLETVDLPALVNSYLLTGNEEYALRALWILDAIAKIYPRANEGPIDYPGLAPGKPDGGRLDRPYYQSARAMMNYAFFAEMLSMSRYAGEPSLSDPGLTFISHIELNLLMNGADYCLRMARAGKGASYELNNGNIDYNRAVLAVGALMGISEWADWALNGPLGFRYAITNSIDINGRYFETGASYALHTRDLLLSTAWFLKRMQMPAFPEGYPAYDNERFAMFALGFFTDIQVAGRLPLFGDSSSDRIVGDGGSIFDKGTLTAAEEFYRFSTKEEIRNTALKTASGMLRDIPAGLKYNANDLFRSSGRREFYEKARLTSIPLSGVNSTLLFDYGTIILRSGERGSERAALMRIGPSLNHSQADELGLAFYAHGREFSYDPGYYNTHLRFGFTTTTVAHNLLVVNRSNQLRRPSPGGDLETWTDGEVLRSATVNNPLSYAHENVTLYRRRITLIDISDDESYIIDNFWARGGREYDYSLHGITGGRLNVNTGKNVTLRAETRGSVLSDTVDYSAELDPNGRVKSFEGEPFYFAPPGNGYGFLSKPAFYALDGPAFLKWSATDRSNHQMYVWHFAPRNSELITASSPKPPVPMHLTYALSHVTAREPEKVRFTSVIHATEGENKIKEVKQLLPAEGASDVFALIITPAEKSSAGEAEHIYFSSDSISGPVNFGRGLVFSGREGFLGLDGKGNVLSASLTGTGSASKDNFRLSVEPLFIKPLNILKVSDGPLKILVSGPYEKTKKLEGCIIRINRPLLARPFVFRVRESREAGRNSWLHLDASSDIHAVGTVTAYNDSTGCITTGSPFPHTRPYVYTYSGTTGKSMRQEENVRYDYNGGYNGFWLVREGNPAQKVMIRDIENKRTSILPVEGSNADFKPGDRFEIRLLVPGDLIEVPVWGEARRDGNGAWQIRGPGIVKVTR